MQYADYYYRFTDESEAMTALDAAGMLTGDGEPKASGPDLAATWALDVIGLIHRDGVQVEGYHVNVRTWGAMFDAPPEALEQYRIPTPDSPAVVWA